MSLEKNRVFQKKYPEIDLYTEDLRHPSKEGTYLAAAVIYRTLFNFDVKRTKRMKDIDIEVTNKIHEIADLTVQSFFN